MSPLAVELLIILVLILLNGFFSLAEMAIVSARKSRLEQAAEEGDRRAGNALRLAKNPNQFLSTVQIGITLIGILTGVFGGATIAREVARGLAGIPGLAPTSDTLGVILVVLLITYLTLVLGELAPKRLALTHPERLAKAVAAPMNLLARLATPLIRLLGASTNLVLRLLGVQPRSGPEYSEDDIKTLLGQATDEGVFEPSEQDMVERIFRLSDRSVSALMTPRTEVTFLEAGAGREEILTILSRHPYAHYPVMAESPDNILGIVETRQLLLACVAAAELDWSKLLQPPLFIPETTPALKTLEKFQQSGSKVAIVMDEYGGMLGVVTRSDLLRAILGSASSGEGEAEPQSIHCADGTWLFDGMLQVDELKEILDLERLPGEEPGLYDTLGGMMMAALGRIPVSGDAFDFAGFRFKVVDMDARRVDKVEVTPLDRAEINQKE